MTNTYYLYRHIRLDKKQPFYIGIGRYVKNSPSFKRAFSGNPRSNAWKSVVNTTPYKVEILFECEDETEIKNKEIEFIKLHGRVDLGQGTLFNFTDGGDTRALTETQKEKLSQRMKGNTLMTGRKLSLETKLKMSLAHKGCVPSEKCRTILRERSIGNTYGAKNKGMKHSLATREKLSAYRQIHPVGRRRVKCITTATFYESIKDCATDMFSGTKGNRQCIGMAASGVWSHYKGYKFEFI